MVPLSTYVIHMAVKLDIHHFSPKSSASRLLVEALREKQSDACARIVTRHFQGYLHSLNEIIKIDDEAVRRDCLRFWHDKALAHAVEKIKPSFDRDGIPFHEYENILMHRYREARAMGDLMAKMRS